MTDPRRPIFIMSPRRLTLVGSPTRHRSGWWPCSRMKSIKARVPWTAGPSSSPVMMKLTVPASGGHLGDGRDHRRDRALHIHRAAPVQQFAAHLGLECAAGPAFARRDHVEMAGEGKMARSFRPGPDGEAVFDRPVRRIARDEPVNRKPSGATIASNASNTSPRAGVTLGAAIRRLASSRTSVILFGLAGVCRRAKARSRFHSPDQCDWLSRALRCRGRRPLVSSSRAAGGPHEDGREPCRAEARRLFLATALAPGGGRAGGDAERAKPY